MGARIHTPQSEWLDLAQADREGPFSKRTLWKLIAERRLAAYRPLKKKILIKRSDLNKLIEGGRVGADLETLIDSVLAEVGRAPSK